MKYVILKKKKKLFFNFITDDGKVLLKGNEHQYIAASEGGVKRVIATSCDATNYHHRKTDDDKHYYFEMHDEAGEVIGTSPLFETHDERTAAIKLMMDGVCGKTMKELEVEPIKERWYYSRGDFDGMNYACYQSEVDQLFYFEILDDTEQVIFTSCEYDNRFDCKDAVRELKRPAKKEDNYTLNKPDNKDYFFELKDANGRLLGQSALRSEKSDISTIAAIISGKNSARVISEQELRRAEAERLHREQKILEDKRIAEEKRLAAEERKRAERKVIEERRRKEKREEMERYREEQERKKIEEERLEEQRKRDQERKRLEKEREEEEKRRLKREKAEQEREEARLRREARKQQKAEKAALTANTPKKKRVKKVVEEEEEVIESDKGGLTIIWILLALFFISLVCFFVFTIF